MSWWGMGMMMKSMVANDSGTVEVLEEAGRGYARVRVREQGRGGGGGGWSSKASVCLDAGQLEELAGWCVAEAGRLRRG